MKTQPPFSFADSCLTQQELQFYSQPWRKCGLGVTQRKPGETARSLPSCCSERWEAALWRRRFLPGLPTCLRRAVSCLPFLAGADTTWVCRQVGSLHWVPGWRPRSQSTGNQRHERIKAERQLQRSPRAPGRSPTVPGPICTGHPHRTPQWPGPGPRRLPHLMGLQQVKQQQVGEAAQVYFAHLHPPKMGPAAGPGWLDSGVSFLL